ncbi:MAG: M15 family peptidase [Alphaproteobacteria bacterium]|nr:M15 family peptidase [Alphaproteobacteria bacterium]
MENQNQEIMVTSAQALKKYGDPTKESSMTVWDIPGHLEMGVIPKKLYCNKDMVAPLSQAFTNLISRGKVSELKTFDGCFNIRKKRGQTSMSLHSWGIAIDVNAAWNCFGCKPVLSPEFVKCFTDAGFEWGGTWSKPDGMHFQLAKI